MDVREFRASFGFASRRRLWKRKAKLSRDEADSLGLLHRYARLWRILKMALRCTNLNENAAWWRPSGASMAEYRPLKRSRNALGVFALTEITSSPIFLRVVPDRKPLREFAWQGRLPH